MGEYMKPYTPSLYYGRYAMMLVELEVCPICNRLMMPRYGGRRYSPFPATQEASEETQLKNAGWVKSGRTWLNGQYVCEECERNGRVLFTCELCGKEQSSTEVQESFGDPPEYLCKGCYASVSAKDWTEKVDGLRKSHQWDYE